MKNSLWIAVCAFLAVLSTVGHTQTVTTGLSYSESLASGGITLPQGRHGRLYGTSTGNGSTENPEGAIFKVNTNGSAPTVLHSFNGTDGQLPAFGMTLAIDGNYYGTTYEGGGANAGVLFKVTPIGAYTPIYQFTNGLDGGYPPGPPIQASDGHLY